MIRKIENILTSIPTIEGDGVRLQRAFGFTEMGTLDPFLLLDDFGSSNPDDYIRGFPWHPHRGIETVTYVDEGRVDHEDSLGNKGSITSGDVQWMTAGGGIIHQEMPQVFERVMRGFQLWVNLPKDHKMMEPRYRDVNRAQIRDFSAGDGTRVKVVAGEVQGEKGPVQDIVVDITYLDVTMEQRAVFEQPTTPGYTTLAYVLEGKGRFDPERELALGNGNLVVFGDGEKVSVRTGDEPVRYLFLSGKPIGEEIAWQGPIVMNTHEELARAFQDYQNGTFIHDS